MKRSLKIGIAIVGSAAALLLIAAVVLPFAVDADRFRPQVEAKLEALLGRRVGLGKLELSLLGGLALRAATFRIGEPLAAPAASALFVEGGSTAIRVAWLPLLHKEVEVRSVTIDGLAVTESGKPLLSGVRVDSRLRIGADGSVAAEGRVEGKLSAMTAAPPLRADFTATLAKSQRRFGL